MTTAEAALLAHVKPATIRSWVNRGLLTPIRKWRGMNIFRVEDVWAAEELAFTRDTSGNASTRQ